MSIAKRIALLVVLLAAWNVAMVNVQADSPCQTACGVTYNSCLADSGDARQMCYTQAEWSYQGCMMGAYETASNCINNAYAFCWMMGGCTPSEVQQIQQWCGDDYQSATQECSSAYSSDTASCNVEEQTANATCATAYNACYNTCIDP
jgi:hypothetical protein